MSGRVFVVQDQQRVNRDTGRLEAKFDLTAARKFGRIVHLLSPTARPWSPQPLVCDMHAALSMFNDDDYLLLLGNPALIGMAVAIAAAHNEGRVNMLQWHGVRRDYQPVRVTGLCRDQRSADRSAG